MPKLLPRPGRRSDLADLCSPIGSEGLLANGRDPRADYRAWYRQEQERLAREWEETERQRKEAEEALVALLWGS